MSQEADHPQLLQPCMMLNFVPLLGHEVALTKPQGPDDHFICHSFHIISESHGSLLFKLLSRSSAGEQATGGFRDILAGVQLGIPQ